MNKLLSFLFLLIPSLATNAATLVIDNGVLTGAQNIDVGGTFYDVEFKDNGDLYDIFGSSPAWDVQSYYEALAFSRGLMEQVFLDGAQGAFDSNPSLIAGCEATTTSACIAVTPFRFSQFGQEINNANLFFASQAINYNSAFDSAGVSPTIDGFRNTAMSATTPFTDYSGGVFADWSPSAAVPLPATAWLFVSALIGLAGIKRKK